MSSTIKVIVTSTIVNAKEYEIDDLHSLMGTKNGTPEQVAQFLEVCQSQRVLNDIRREVISETETWETAVLQRRNRKPKPVEDFTHEE